MQRMVYVLCCGIVSLVQTSFWASLPSSSAVTCVAMVRSEPGVSLQSATTDLQSVEATLDAVLYNGTTNASALADQINAVTPSISTTPFQSSTLTALARFPGDRLSSTVPEVSQSHVWTMQVT